MRPSTLAPLDFPAAALVSLGRDASMVVVGSRGLGGFLRSLIIGSNSLATASMASCPVVIVQDGRPDEDDRSEDEEAFSDIVAGVAADESSEAVLQFAFATAATRPGARLRIVHGWTMFSSMLAGCTVFDRESAADSARRGLAELTSGWQERYPQVEVVREPVNGPASRTLVYGVRHGGPDGDRPPQGRGVARSGPLAGGADDGHARAGSGRRRALLTGRLSGPADRPPVHFPAVRAPWRGGRPDRDLTDDTACGTRDRDGPARHR
ncbi:hypothetical protein SMICM17S_06183 [Streptomyces microflavus]